MEPKCTIQNTEIQLLAQLDKAQNEVLLELELIYKKKICTVLQQKFELQNQILQSFNERRQHIKDILINTNNNNNHGDQITITNLMIVDMERREVDNNENEQSKKKNNNKTKKSKKKNNNKNKKTKKKKRRKKRKKSYNERIDLTQNDSNTENENEDENENENEDDYVMNEGPAYRTRSKMPLTNEDVVMIEDNY